jgi:hypothetical protein
MIQPSSFVDRVVPPRNAVKAVLWAWLLAGTLDISAAVIFYAHASRVQTMRLLQGIASGVLGDKAFTGAFETAMLGLALHYAIALIWTLVFLVIVRRVTGRFTNLFVVGMAYGVIVWIVMNLIVLPLSNVRHAPIYLPQAIIGAVILMFCIGLPIALTVGRYREG